MIAAVTIGENDGASSSYAYITSSQPNREAYDANADEYTWTREAVVNGEIVELREVGDTLEYLSRANMKQGEWYEIKYDVDGNVRKVEDIPFAASNDHDDAHKYISEVLDVELSVNDNDTVLLADLGDHDDNAYDITALTFKNGTLYTDTNATLGFSVSPDVKVVLALADKNGAEFDEVSDGYTGYNGLEKALRDLNANSAGFAAGTVEVSAVLENGVATSIVINDTNAKGSTVIVTPGPSSEMGVTVYEDARTIVANFVDGTSTTQMRNAIYSAMRNAGIEPLYVDMNNYVAMAEGGYFYDLTVNTYYSITVDNDVVDYALCNVNNASKAAKTTKAITVTGDGTHAKVTADGASPSTSYKTYANASYASGATVSGNTVIETGYVGRPGIGSVAGGTLTMDANIKSAGFVKYGSNLTLTYTASTPAAADTTVTLAIANAGTATVPAAQVLKTGKSTLTFTLSNITAQTGDITVTTAAVPADATVTAGTITNDKGLTVSNVIFSETNVKVGDEVTMTFTVSGTVASGNTATLTVADSNISGVSWSAAELAQNGITESGGALTFAGGRSYNATLTYTFTVNDDVAPTITIV